MKPEEVIDALNYFKRRRAMYLDDLIQKRENIAIQALEKQVSKPIKYATRCPTCDEIWYDDKDGYCNNCGQKLEDASYRKEVKE